MIIPIESDVYVYNDYADDIPTHIRVDINDELLTWIRKMEQIVQDNNIAYIADYEYSPKYIILMEDEDDPCEFTDIECQMIVVRKGSFYWKGLIKHTNINYESESISMEDIQEYIDFFNSPIKDMPMHIHDEDYSKKEIALRRMRGDE